VLKLLVESIVALTKMGSWKSLKYTAFLEREKGTTEEPKKDS